MKKISTKETREICNVFNKACVSAAQSLKLLCEAIKYSQKDHTWR